MPVSPSCAEPVGPSSPARALVPRSPAGHCSILWRLGRRRTARWSLRRAVIRCSGVAWTERSRIVNWEAYPRCVDGVQVNEVTDGYVVYDPRRERIHYLNHTAVVLLELCTGTVKAGDLPAMLQAAYELPEPPVTEVATCLQKLFDEGLVS